MFITHEIRNKAANLALVATAVLTGLKLIVGVVSGSVGVISEGIHSFLDVVSASLSFFTVREAVKPADHEHPFGHGKIETLSSLFESILLIVAAAWIVYEGIDHLLNPNIIDHQDLAIITILLSLIVNYLVYLNNSKAAELTDSSAIRVNALHFLADVVASAGVLVGLLILKFTGWMIVDPLLAFCVAVYILVISLKQVKKAFLELTDTQLPEIEINRIKDILNSFEAKVIEIHDLRTRKSGFMRHIDFHLVLCGEQSVKESHDICDQIEQGILNVFTNSSIQIHVEPCEHNDTRCVVKCASHHKKKRKLK
ncbi:MAG: cation transporter [Deltaproteobacteria bacterium]|nr:cation transporter [Deltaproteobacteria bacterium]